MNDVTRRDFFGMTAGAVFLYGFHVPASTANDAPKGGPFAPNAFIRIDDKGIVTLIIPQVEMGQGVYTSLSQIVAEELDADWNRVRVEHAPPNEKLYVNPMLGVQATGNSNAIRGACSGRGENPARIRGPGLPAAKSFNSWIASAIECAMSVSRCG